MYPTPSSTSKSLGIPIPASGNRGGSLGVRFSGLASSSEGAVNVRITTKVPGGQAGVAYGGVPTAAVLFEPTLITGLRNNATDRSDVAVQNPGALGERRRNLALDRVFGRSQQSCFTGIARHYARCRWLLADQQHSPFQRTRFDATAMFEWNV